MIIAKETSSCPSVAQLGTHHLGVYSLPRKILVGTERTQIYPAILSVDVRKDSFSKWMLRSTSVKFLSASSMKASRSHAWHSLDGKRSWIVERIKVEKQLMKEPQTSV